MRKVGGLTDVLPKPATCLQKLVHPSGQGPRGRRGAAWTGRVHRGPSSALDTLLGPHVPQRTSEASRAWR